MIEKVLSQPSAAETYERMVVPGLFRPHAQELLQRARPIGASDRVLDLGCGTGIVARVLRERLGGGARITGLDASAPMLAVARTLAPEIEWHEGNAAAMPFADGSFDLVVSQAMLQFVPDQVACLREIRRVLAPGGRLVLSTWRARSEQPLHDALGKLAERHFGASNDRRWCAGDGEALRANLREAGFNDVNLEVVSVVEQQREIAVRLSVMAGGFNLSAFSDEERERRMAAIEAEGKDVIARFALEGGYGAPVTANVLTATA